MNPTVPDTPLAHLALMLAWYYLPSRSSRRRQSTMGLLCVVESAVVSACVLAAGAQTNDLARTRCCFGLRLALV